MARQELTIRNIPGNLTSLAQTAETTDGEQFSNVSGRTFIYYKNTDASPITLTFITVVLLNGISPKDITLTIPAGKFDIIGTFHKGFHQLNSTKIHINYSAALTGKIMALVLK